MSNEAKGILSVKFDGAPSTDAGWYPETEISLRGSNQTSYSSEIYCADDKAVIQVGVHQPSGELGISWSTTLNPESFVLTLDRLIGAGLDSVPVEVHTSDPRARTGHIITGVFFELEDYLHEEIGDDVVSAVHVSVYDQLVRWSSADTQHGMNDSFARVEIRAFQPDSNLVASLLGETACSSLIPQFRSALSRISVQN